MAEEDELESLRKQLSLCRRVEILDDGTKRVVAQGQLEEGSYESGGKWFRIRLKKPSHEADDEDNGEEDKKDAMHHSYRDHAVKTPLRDLCNLRVCVGGLHQGQFSSASDFRLDFTYKEGNSERSNSKGILFTAQSQQLAIHMVIQGWPSKDWCGGVTFETPNSTDNTQQDALDFLSATLPLQYPDATISFESVYLFSDMNQGVIRNLPASIREKLEQGLAESQAQFLFIKLVANRLRFVLDDADDSPESFEPQVRRVVDALAMLDIDSIEHLSTAKNKSTMEYIIQMHKVSRESSNIHHFEECVNGLLVEKQNKQERQRRKSETLADALLTNDDSD